MSSTDNWDDESDPDALLPTADDWLRLAELRESFLAAEGGRAADSYWRSRRDFELYDATFAARIGWKALDWPAPYRSAKPQLEAGFARAQAQAQAPPPSGSSPSGPSPSRAS